MALSHILPEFGARIAKNTVTLTDVSLEDQKLASYEAGYQAGWDDSARANSEAGNQISADFAQNIRDVSMTYHEAYAALLADVKPFLAQIVEAVLPAMARDTMGPRILELIEAEMESGPRRALTLFAATQDCTFLQPLIDGLDDSIEVILQSDTTLMAGQVRLSFSDEQELELDSSALIAGIQTALHGFFESHDAGETNTSTDLQTLRETA